MYYPAKSAKTPFMHILKSLFITAIVTLVTGCATQPPLPIRESIPIIPDIRQVQQNFSQYKGARVRWGGEIYSIKNLKSETQLEIISRPLDEEASPIAMDASGGRFLAIFKGFLEPSVFTQGRFITVIGNITAITKGNIGSYEYNFPVVVADTYYLWPKARYIYYPYPYPRRYDPFYYDPWYPWYPWYPWWY